MEFKKYNSIENSYQDDFISSIIEQGFGDLEYVVQEKIHGANLSFITDGKSILSAKRIHPTNYILIFSGKFCGYSLCSSPVLVSMIFSKTYLSHL